MKKRVLLGVLFAVAIVFICSTISFADSILSPKRTQGLQAPVAMNSSHNLVTLVGPGKFVSAEISKQGGATDLTFISLDIDGVNVVSVSIAALKNWGLTANNPYGLVLLESGAGVKTLTIGFNSPLVYQRELKLKVDVKESGVVQVVANVIHGK
jgi:hypothetical protein